MANVRALCERDTATAQTAVDALIRAASRAELHQLAQTIGVGVSIVAGRKVRLTGAWDPLSDLPDLRGTFDPAELVAASARPQPA